MSAGGLAARPRRADAEVREVLRGAVPSPRRLAVPVLLGVLSAGSGIALIMTSAWLIARAAEQPPVMYLGVAVVGVRAFALGRSVFRYGERLTGHDASFRQLAAIRAGVFERLVPLAPDGLVATRRGDLLARFTADVDELQFLPLRAIQPVVSAAIVLVAAVAGIAVLVPEAALAEGMLLAAGILVALLAQRAAGARADRGLAAARGALQAAVVEHLDAAETLVAFDADAADRDRIADLGARLQREIRRRAAAQGLANAVVAALGGIGALAGILLAAPHLAGGSLSGPAFAVVCLVPLAIAEVAAAVPAGAGAVRASRAAAARVAGAAPAAVPVGAAADPLEPTPAVPSRRAPELVLRGLSAHWPRLDGAAVPDVAPVADGAAVPDVERGRDGEPAPGDGPARPGIRDVSLVLRPGERVLLRGPSGSGKTTLAHVLVGFLDHTGEYLIDGVEAREAGGDAVRERVGLVEQRPWLFDESIRHNLDFADETADDAELERVLERVGLAGWVADRGGLDARVGERGALVSGGQAQRLALARAMLRGFPVLVLDEPTAHVEPELADRLLDELLEAGDAPGRTIVCIAHAGIDPRRFDRVLEVRDGRILEPGPSGSGGHCLS